MANKRGETERTYPVPPNTTEHSITFMTRESDAVSRVYLTIQKIYLKDRGYNSNKRICIGRLDYRLPPDWKETGKRPTQMIPNENYSVYFPEYRWGDEAETASSPEESTSDNRDMDAAFFSDSVKVGSYLMIDAVVSRLKLRELLASEFSDTEINRCLDLASYLVICGDDAVLHFSRYAYDHALFDTDGRADDAALNLSDFLDDDGISVFMRKWSAARRRKSATNRFYLFADGTQPTGQAGETELIGTGASESPGGQSAPNMMLAVDGDNGLPILYDMYGGPVDAPSEYAFMANRFTGMQDMVGAVLDRGCISKEQIACLDQHGLACIIPAKGDNRLFLTPL
ncbi:MAG: hypothetical protein IJ088_03870 [Clostridia bacterium]|nr:hypothetical protein [Clostridia bacterium]